MFDANTLLSGVLGGVLTLAVKYWYLIVLVLAIGFLGALSSGKKRGERGVYQYERKECVMTNAERAFYTNLMNIVGERYYAFPQIHLNDLVEHRTHGQNWRGAFRHINEKSVDFVLCEKASLRTALVIELDDATHARADRIARDSEVERILRESNIPLVRVRVADASNGEALRRLLSERLTWST